MFRLVLLASLGVVALKPVFGDELARPAMTPAVVPASAIARSQFALAQRDAQRAQISLAKPVLQASAPLNLVEPANLPASTRPKSAAPGAGASTVSSTPIAAPRLAPVLGSLVPLDPPTPPVPSPALRIPGSGKRALPAQSKPAQSKAAVARRPPTTKSAATRLAALPFPEPKNTSPVEPLVARALRPGPKSLSSRDMMRLRGYDSALGGELKHLNRAETNLTRYQRQLGVFTSVLNTAMMKNGEEGAGLNPFVRVAIRYRGTPYVWGGESARGFDCSGFIMRVMRDLGYRALPHSAAEQFNYGMPVARQLLKPGDIVFFANTYKAGVSHVGIYLGQRQFIHAAGSKIGTIVSSIDDPKWVEHYAGARRLLITHT